MKWEGYRGKKSMVIKDMKICLNSPVTVKIFKWVSKHKLNCEILSGKQGYNEIQKLLLIGNICHYLEKNMADVISLYINQWPPFTKKKKLILD